MDSTKDAIRRAVRRRRRALPPAFMEQAERAIVDRMQAFAPFIHADAVIAYVATDGEVPTTSLLSAAANAGKRLYLPRVDADRMWFAEYRFPDPLRTGRFGIPEPDGEPLVPSAHAALVAFVPLLAWDTGGNRLGRGAGFYDRTLPGLGNGLCAVGLAYAWQQHETLPREPWDVLLDYVITERDVVRCGSSAPPAPMRKEESGIDGLPMDDTDRRCTRRSGGMAARLSTQAASAGAGTRDAGDR